MMSHVTSSRRLGGGAYGPTAQAPVAARREAREEVLGEAPQHRVVDLRGGEASADSNRAGGVRGRWGARGGL